MEVHDSRRGGGCKVHKNAELFNKQHNFLEEIQELKKWKNLRNLELTSNVKKHDIKISLREKDNFVLKGFKDLESNAYKRKTSILHVWIWGHYFQKREGHWTCISWKVKSICCLKHSLNFYLMRERLSVNSRQGPALEIWNKFQSQSQLMGKTKIEQIGRRSGTFKS